MKKSTIKLARPLLILAVLAVMAVVVMSIGASPDETGATNAPQGKAMSFVVLMEGQPLATYQGDIKGMPATKPNEGKKVNVNSKAAKKYDKFLRGNQAAAQREAGVSKSAVTNTFTVALNGFSAVMTKAQAEELSKQDGVLLVMQDQWRQPMTDSSPDFLGLTAPAGPFLLGVQGEGVVVGVIDTGIWPEHPSFADDGTYPAPPITLSDDRPNCEFGNTAHNPEDVPFECNNKLIGARQMLDTYRFYIGAEPTEFDSARDDGGHGTHTASTAAGNSGVPAYMYDIYRGDISGMAPRAHVVAYKGLGSLGGFTSDLAAAINQAVTDGVDVINYSIGGGAGLPGADEIAFLNAALAGVDVATSAGNSGPGAATMGSPGVMPWMTTVGANTESRFFQGTVVLGDGSEYTGASITPGTDGVFPLVDAEDIGYDNEDRCLLGSLDPVQAEGKIVLCRRGSNARAEKSQAVYEAGGVGMVMYNNSDDDNLATDTHWVPSVHTDLTPGLAVKAYIASAGASATAEIIGEQVTEWPYAPSMTIFSSRGPNPIAPDVIKPDITAPGTQTLAGYSPAAAESYDLPNQMFAAIQGTSMSSPHMAGIFALMNQVHPDWSAAMIKSAVMTTSYQDVVDNDRVSQASPFAMGAGHVDVGSPVHKGSAFQPGLVYDAGLFEYAAFTCGMDWGIYTPGSCDYLESIGVPTEPWNLNLPSIGIASVPGTQTVQRTVTSVAQDKGWREYTAVVEAPKGFIVNVSPSTLRLKSGQSATFEVTVTNVAAPAEEWRFGSLTWVEKTGNYTVFSPIAVKAAPFAAPSAVSGSGETGSVSFDVNFGYTGSYTAAAHGLDQADHIVDNVVQDPDQNFDPNDGYSNAYTYNLSGDAYFRIALPPEGVSDPDAIDLDVFVYNPNGVQVASSTNGGTNELIEIWNPMDGAWTVYVHGWQTAGLSADFEMWVWAVSATPGGSLVIDSAPASATAGTIEPIVLSWTGATMGEWHYGLVSHTGDSGLMGYTLVDVDNR